MSRSRPTSPLALLLVVVALLAVAGAALASGALAPADDAGVPSEPSEPAADAAPARPPQPAEEPILDVETPEPVFAATATWQFQSRENCYDMFTLPCQQSHFPDPFCPSNPAGKPCSQVGTSCWVIISSSWADEYLCKF